MNLFELFIIAIGLSMDAFAVAICKGLSMNEINIRKAGIVGLYFGIFQAGMPLIGYFLGIRFHDKIAFMDHWIAFILLVLIGLDIIRVSKNCECETENDSLSFKNMSILAIATSIDALVVGVTFAFLNINITQGALFIGIITFLLSVIGVKMGNTIGNKCKSKAEVVGGLILILMGFKILLSHLGIINF